MGLAGTPDYDAYTKLLKLALIDALNPRTERAVSLGDGRVRIEEVPEAERAQRFFGRDWPANGTTMVGYQRLTQVQNAIETILCDDIPGDLIEAGVWRGGTVIFMRALLDWFEDEDRLVVAADSFEGLPSPDPENFEADAGDLHHAVNFLKVSQVEVEKAFRRFCVSMEKVSFIKGFFRQTLPNLNTGGRGFSLIRLDGDMYESTAIALRCLYPQLSRGGFLIVDDYALPNARKAVEDYRAEQGIDAEIVRIDQDSIYWRNL